MDYNWFFSSVAQSIAALVGVLGAFLISRILTNEAGFEANRSRTRELLGHGQSLADRANVRYFEWFSEHSLERELNRIQQEIEDGEALHDAESYYLRYAFPRYLPRAEVVARIHEVLAEAHPGTRDLSLIGRLVDSGGLQVGLEQEEELINQLVCEIKAHLRALEAHLNVVRRNPERSIAVRLALAASLLLFWGGVIYPLGFLPANVQEQSPSWFIQPLTSPRMMILAAAGFIFTALILALGFLNERLRYSSEEIDGLQHWLEPGAYADSFQIQVDNGFPL